MSEDERTRVAIVGGGPAGLRLSHLLHLSGVDRVVREGDRHDGIELRFDGESHRVDLHGLTGRAVWLYPQTKVFEDLAERRAADGGDLRWGATVTDVLDLHGERPGVRWTDADGATHQLRCDVLVGADGS